MTEQAQTPRNNYLDIVKGFLIISVVVGHCIQHGSGIAFLNGACFYDNWLFKFIYSFHMPLFMLLSGYFFANTVARTGDGGRWTVAKKRIRTLLIPILIWSIIPISVFAIKLFKNGIPDDITAWNIVEKVFHITTNNLWFLWAVLYNSLIVIFVNKCCKDNIYVYAAIFILLFFLPYSVGLYCYMYPYFVLGYLYRKHFAHSKLTDKIAKNRTWWNIALGIIFLIMLLLFKREHYIYTSSYNILRGNMLHQLGIDLFRFTIGLVGSLFILFTIKSLHNLIGDKKGIIAYIGRATMGIYIVSSPLSPVILDICRKLNGCNYLLIIVESVIVIAISLLATILIKYNRTASKLLLGS